MKLKSSKPVKIRIVLRGGEVMKKRILGLALCATLFAGSLVGCGGNAAKPESEKKASSASTQTVSSARQASETKPENKSETPASTKPEHVTLNVAYMPNYASLWAIENAIAQGYMEEEGITVNLTEFQDGPTIIAAMESGSIDIGYIGQGAHKLCINGKASIFALSQISNADAVIGGKDVKTVADLKGKKVAYSSGTSSEDILMKTLIKGGMKLEDIQAVDMDASAIVTAMLSGGVDACATWSPNTLKILDEMKDATKLSDNLTFKDTTVSLASWIVMPKFAAEKRDVLVRYTRALFKAMDYAAKDHQEETSELIAKRIASDKDTVYAQRGDADWLTGKEVAAGAADGTVEKYYELQKKDFIAAGAVEGDPAVKDYVMLDVMIEAGK